MADASKVRDMIEEFIEQTPPGTLNEDEITQPETAGNGEPTKKRGRPPTKVKRGPSAWNLFTKEYIAKHKDVPFAQASHDAGIEWQKIKLAAKKPAAKKPAKAKKPAAKPKAAAKAKKAVREAEKELKAKKREPGVASQILAQAAKVGREGAVEELVPGTPPRLGGPPESFRRPEDLPPPPIDPLLLPPTQPDVREILRGVLEDPLAVTALVQTPEVRMLLNRYLKPLGKRIIGTATGEVIVTERPPKVEEIEEPASASASRGKEEAEVTGEGFDFKHAVDEIQRRLKGVSEAFKGTRKNWPPAAREVLEKYGGQEFHEVKVCRRPLSEALQSLIKTAALPKRGNFDKFYHLSLWLKLADKKWLRLDKREVLHAVIENRDVEPSAVCIPVRLSPDTPRTADGILGRTLKKVGQDRFFKYRSTSWNCQRWVMDIIESNDMHVNKAWVLQDVNNLLSPIVSRIADLSTDLKARASLILEGFGISEPDDEFILGLGKIVDASTPNTQERPDLPDQQRIDDAQNTEKVMKAKEGAYMERATGGSRCDSESDSDSDGVSANLMKDMRKFVGKRLGIKASDADVMKILRDEEFGGILIGGFVASKKKKKQKLSPYRKALMEWNRGRKVWKIPRKGSKGYMEVQALKLRYM